jgi:conjugal transfer pilus assembly protein TraV
MLAKLLLLVLSILALTGCASLGIGKSEYSCKGYPKGVTCKSAREVYALTEYQESVRSTTKNDKEKCPDCQSKQQSQEERKDVTQNLSPEVQAVRQTTYSGPIPIRTPSKIIRIWIAPWEDTDGFLHLESYIYAEIEPRRWMIGEQAPKVSRRLKPLQVDMPRQQKRQTSASVRTPGFSAKAR